MNRSLLRVTIALIGVFTIAVGTSPAGFVNGRFATGDFSGWTVYTLDGGTIGTPTVVAFGTADNGADSAVRLQVGNTSSLVGSYTGGGLSQVVSVAGGTYQFSIDLASARPIGIANADGGKFELVVDGVVRATHDFGVLEANITERQHLETALALGAGEHEFRLQFTRHFRGDNQTPYQFLDNAFLSSDADSGGSGTTIANPLPGGAVLFGLGLATLGVGRLVRRRVMAA